MSNIKKLSKSLVMILIVFIIIKINNADTQRITKLTTTIKLITTIKTTKKISSQAPSTQKASSEPNTNPALTTQDYFNASSSVFPIISIFDINRDDVKNLAQLSLSKYAKLVSEFAAYSYELVSIKSATYQQTVGGYNWNISLIANKYDEEIFFEKDICNFYIYVTSFNFSFLNSECINYDRDRNQQNSTLLDSTQATIIEVLSTKEKPASLNTLISSTLSPFVSLNTSDPEVEGIARIAIRKYNAEYFASTIYSFSLFYINSASYEQVNNGTMWNLDLTVIKNDEGTFVEANNCKFLLFSTSTATLKNSTCVLLIDFYFSMSIPIDD